MKSKKLKKLTFIALLNLVFVCTFMSISFAANKISTSKIIPDQGSWIIDSELNNAGLWDIDIDNESPIPDLDWSISGGQANLKVIGDSGTFSEISGVPLYGDWNMTNNPEFPVLPDFSNITAEGCRVDHTWDENINQTRNTPSALWQRTVTMPVNMSDYRITSASLQATFNASVVTSPRNNGIDTPNDGIIQFATGDHARFYVLISDLNQTKSYEIAYNQTKYLGQDADPAIPSFADTFMESVPEEILIAYLTSIFETNNFNFQIILGINLYCEDNNPGTDIDIWNYLIIRECNLAFTYEKIINKGSTISLNQIGNSITGENVTITRANLIFQYKIDQDWTSDSEFSELRIYINNNKFGESIKLSNYDTPNVFVNAEIDGFELPGQMFPLDEDIKLTIQLYLANTFNLDLNITVSIDKVYMEVYWQEYVEDVLTPIEKLLKEPWFATLLAILVTTGLVSLGIGFVYYYRVGRFPLAVRKVRKYRKSLNKVDPPKGIRIIDRNSAFKHQFSDQTKVISRDLKDRSLGKKIKQTVLLGEFNKFINGSKGD